MIKNVKLQNYFLYKKSVIRIYFIIKYTFGLNSQLSHKICLLLLRLNVSSKQLVSHFSPYTIKPPSFKTPQKNLSKFKQRNFSSWFPTVSNFQHFFTLISIASNRRHEQKNFFISLPRFFQCESVSKNSIIVWSKFTNTQKVNKTRKWWLSFIICEIPSVGWRFPMFAWRLNSN